MMLDGMLEDLGGLKKEDVLEALKPERRAQLTRDWEGAWRVIASFLGEKAADGSVTVAAQMAYRFFSSSWARSTWSILSMLCASHDARMSGHTVSLPVVGPDGELLSVVATPEGAVSLKMRFPPGEGEAPTEGDRSALSMEYTPKGTTRSRDDNSPEESHGGDA